MARQPKKNANKPPSATSKKGKSKPANQEQESETTKNSDARSEKPHPAGTKPTLLEFLASFKKKLKEAGYKHSKPNLKLGIEIFTESIDEPLLHDCGALVICYVDFDYEAEGNAKQFIMKFSRDSTKDMSDSNLLELTFVAPLTPELEAIDHSMDHTRRRCKSSTEFRTMLAENLPELETILGQPGPWSSDLDIRGTSA